jgi:hypothetical protein
LSSDAFPHQVPILLGHPADHEYILPHKARQRPHASKFDAFVIYLCGLQDAAIKAWEFPNPAAMAA